MADNEDEHGLFAERGETIRENTRQLDTLIEHPQEPRLKQWILLSGRRVVVTFALLVGVFALMIALAVARPVDTQRLVTETNTLQTLFSALLSGAILLVSIVVSINSIILSQEITDIDTEQQRIDSSLEFRRRTEELIEGDTSPVRPAAFLRAILHTIYIQTRTLGELADQSDDGDFRREVESFGDEVIEDARQTSEQLHGARFGTFKVLSAGLNYSYSWQLNAVRQLKRRHSETLTDDEREALDDLIATLKFFATGREYFQSLYYKREMARLSSMLLYVSLPVIVFISYFLLALNSQIIPDVRFAPLSAFTVFVIFAYTVSLAPYLILTSYVIRIATISLRTLAAGPFILRKQTADGEDRVEWNMDQSTAVWESRDTAEEEPRNGAEEESRNVAEEESRDMTEKESWDMAEED